MARRTRALRKPLFPIRFARLHARLVISVVLGVVVALGASFSNLDTTTRLLAGWNSGVVIYLALTYWMITFSGVPEIRRRAAADDEGAFAVLLLSAAASLVSLGAIVVELGNAKSAAGSAIGAHVALGMTTIVLSWSFVHTMFTLHYAHEYYGERRDRALGGLNFPGKEQPDYWDFLYFSLVVAMTSQVSDVTITSKTIRRDVSIHGVLSFFFNLAIIALTINMISNLV